MSCELFTEDLKPMGFSDASRCVYEDKCPFAGSRLINKFEAVESCLAIADERNHQDMTMEDLEQEAQIRSLLSIGRVN